MKKILIFLLSIPMFHIANAQVSKSATDTILTSTVEKSCTGGFAAFNNYVEKYSRPPVGVIEKRVGGTTYVSFVIEADGSVSHVCTILPAGYGMDEEAIRVVSMSNNWLPAIINNKPVRSFCRVGVEFLVDAAEHMTSIRAKQIE